VANNILHISLRLLLALIAFDLSSLSQAKLWQFTFSSGDTLGSCRLVALSTDSLNVAIHDTVSWIPIIDIVEIRYVRRSRVCETATEYAVPSAIAGAAVSAIIIGLSARGTDNGITKVDDCAARFYGVLFGAPFYGAACGILGGFVGGGVGLAESADEVHDLSGMSLNQRIHTIRMLLAQESN